MIRRHPSGLDDAGSASVLALATGAALLVVCLVSAASAGAVAFRHRLAAVADLTALAGAARVTDGPRTVCVVAATAAVRNGARLSRCEVAGSVVTVSVSARPAGLLHWSVAVTLNSRAGPAETVPDRPTTFRWLPRDTGKAGFAEQLHQVAAAS